MGKPEQNGNFAVTAETYARVIEIRIEQEHVRANLKRRHSTKTGQKNIKKSYQKENQERTRLLEVRRVDVLEPRLLCRFCLWRTREDAREPSSCEELTARERLRGSEADRRAATADKGDTSSEGGREEARYAAAEPLSAWPVALSTLPAEDMVMFTAPPQTGMNGFLLPPAAAVAAAVAAAAFCCAYASSSREGRRCVLRVRRAVCCVSPPRGSVDSGRDEGTPLPALLSTP